MGQNRRNVFLSFYTVAGRAIGFALEQPLHVVALACSALGILKQLDYTRHSPLTTFRFWENYFWAMSYYLVSV
ncbi:MAG: hypothetical protein LBJ00_16185 [Planctomycetaceae bacterium]|jgi:hypothetical protein|nr:hypothetical protein [Planctomycetaceae bacterium]